MVRLAAAAAGLVLGFAALAQPPSSTAAPRAPGGVELRYESGPGMPQPPTPKPIRTMREAADAGIDPFGRVKVLAPAVAPAQETPWMTYASIATALVLVLILGAFWLIRVRAQRQPAAADAPAPADTVA